MAVGPLGAQQAGVPKPAAPATASDWAEAVKIVRQVALDTDRPAEQRVSAVIAHARMQLAQGKPAEALKTSWEVFNNPKDQAVAVAALQAASLVSRQTHDHLGAQQALVDDWAKKAVGAASKQAINVLRADLNRTRGYLMGLAGRRPTPAPIRPAMPSWGRPDPRSGPRALGVASPKPKVPRCVSSAADPRAPSPFQVKLPVAKPPAWGSIAGKNRPPAALSGALPVYNLPPWYGRARFPLLKEPSKS